MIRINEAEEIIRLIHKGYDIELLSFELDIPINELQEYKKRLEFRQSVKKSIKKGKVVEAIDRLNSFIENTDDNIIERAMLLKLKAYSSRTMTDEKELKKIEEERKKLGFYRKIDDILEELKVQIPQRKSSKKIEEEKNINPDYEEIINKYKTEISSNPQKAQEKRNLLAFAYFKAGKVDEAIDELMSLIEETSSHMAYRQLIHIEKEKENYEDAKLWADMAIEQFPNSIEIRELLISIAKKEKNDQEVIRQLKTIIDINPENERNKERLKRIMDR